jgi:hypothetical protein
MDRGHRQNRQKAAMLGMTVHRTRDVDPVVDCLAESGARKNFAVRLDRRKLQAALDLLGEDGLRMYVCYDSKGQPASSCIVLHAVGARSIGWLSGTRTNHLVDGSSAFLWRSVFDDLTSAGAIGIDFCATDGRTLAAFKSRWGSRLAIAYNVRTYSAVEKSTLRAVDIARHIQGVAANVRFRQSSPRPRAS